jgi:hypothetical protein
MKTILILCGVVLLAGAGVLVWRLLRAEHHGALFNNPPAVSLKALKEQPEQHLGKSARIEGRIARQCPASGCWFILDDGQGNKVHVEMSGSTPTLPQRVGKRAVVEGQLIKMGEEYEFTGTGVEFK